MAVYYSIRPQLAEIPAPKNEDSQSSLPHIIIMTPEEAANGTFLQTNMYVKLEHSQEVRFCKAEAHKDFLYGTFVIPPKSNNREKIAFRYLIAKDRIIFIEDGGFVKHMIDKMQQAILRENPGIGFFFSDFLDMLISEDLLYLTELENQIAHHEDEVLAFQIYAGAELEIWLSCGNPAERGHRLFLCADMPEKTFSITVPRLPAHLLSNPIKNPHPITAAHLKQMVQQSDDRMRSLLPVFYAFTAPLFRSNSFLIPCTATITPRIRSKTANISWRVLPRLKPVVINAFPSLKIVIPKAVKVTAIINTMGIHSMAPCLLVRFRKTAQAIRARTDNSWFAEPNSGHISAYPTFASKYASISVIAVAKYLFVTTLRKGLMFSSSVSSSMKNSWKERRPTRATESRDVNANAETARLIKVNTRL